MQLSGTLPACISSFTRLSTLLTHRNQFSGDVPILDHLNELNSLTLFDNDFGGQLSLPISANFTLLLAQSNRLSCRIRDSATTADQQMVLVLPGNAFSAPIPQWAPTRQVSFLYSHSWQDSWLISLVISLFGLASVGCMLFWFRNTGRVDMHVLLSSTTAEIQTRAWCSIVLAKCSILSVVFIIVYFKGSHFYKCGKPWLYVTAAYLHDTPYMELITALVACIFAALAAAFVRTLDQKSNQLYPATQTSEPKISTEHHVMIWLLWIPILFLLSVPILLYIMATTLPPQDNSWGLPKWALEVFQYGAGPFLYMTSVLLLPPLSRRVVYTVCGMQSPNIAVRLMTVARVLISLVVPFAMILVFNQQCHAFWLRLWDPCFSDKSTFDISLELGYEIVRSKRALAS